MRPAIVAPGDLSETYDVVVVGYGYAGGMAAIAAHDAGARVLILEKAATAGGISICSAGGVRYARSEAGVAAYLERTCAGTTPLPVLRVLAQAMAALPEQIRELAAINQAEVSVEAATANYPLEGYDSFGFVNVEAIPGFDPRQAYPHVRGSPNGALLFKVVADNVERRGIPVLYRSRAERLLLAPDGGLAGVELLSQDGRRQRIGARRGVILAAGGFEADPEMQRQYWSAGPALSAAYKLNTGDGIRMGQGAGADLWHMWHYHGSYGYRHPDPAYPYAIRVKRLPDWRPGEGRQLPRMAWILLDRGGRRFMNEYEPYLQDTGHRPLGEYDPVRQDYPRMPAFLVTDETGRKLYPLGRPTYNDPDVAFDWSEDNSAEIGLGIFTKAGDLDDLARAIGTDARRGPRIDRRLERCLPRRPGRRLRTSRFFDDGAGAAALLCRPGPPRRLEHPRRPGSRSRPSRPRCRGPAHRPIVRRRRDHQRVRASLSIGRESGRVLCRRAHRGSGGGGGRSLAVIAAGRHQAPSRRCSRADTASRSGSSTTRPP